MYLRSSSEYRRRSTGRGNVRRMQLKKFRNDKYIKLQHYIKHGRRSIQMSILIPFTVVSLVFMLVLALVLYRQFRNRSLNMQTQSTQQLQEQMGTNLEDYLRNMRRMSDALYYDVIKEMDFSTSNVDSEMTLLYEANKDNLVSFALFREDGDLISAAPVAVEKETVDVTQQSWFTDATQQMENLHFSTPHVQNLFDDTTYRYYWVISLSRVVELTDNGKPETGVLLVDMDYSTIEQMLVSLNENNSQQYTYLCDSSGELIYHPHRMQIDSGTAKEDNLLAATYEDGVHKEEFNDEGRTVIVRTIGYTGWRLVSVIPDSTFSMSMAETRYFIVMIITLVLLVLLLTNQFVSYRVTRPIRKLNSSIKRLENGTFSPDVYVGGSLEVHSLGVTLRSSFLQIQELMQDIVKEQESKRKSELDALQSQINPHFLYNTLDSIVWMIEGERYEEAVFMITQLASLFRISLSKGRTIIRITEELQHAENYANIQKVRFKNAFFVTFDVAEDVKNCCTVKLIVQPLLENAIYYGVKGMEEDGEINISAFRDTESEDGDVIIRVKDNGYGIPQEEVELLLTDRGRARSKGSGVGLINVHERVRLRFGDKYGLTIRSELDEGTCVDIRLPYIPYTEEKEGQRNEKD